MDLDVIMLTEINQRKRNTTWFHLHVQSKIKTNNNFKKSRNRIIDIENKMVITRGNECQRSHKIGERDKEMQIFCYK